ncbi:uncharacterized protein CXorf38-like [Notolabrus celidotus]|uniref:uncharacterized protein CXorf38-like n=1 Tax=Notolabrus celidotus TaxID=1203425 RepID=UPI00148F5A7D|nr:uncharacterized protein CXorf38-like [Notolabrus celidotus]
MVLEDLKSRLNNREYKNWLKAGQCLRILKEGLHPFISLDMRAFHGDLLNKNTQLRKPCSTSACKPKGNQLTSACRTCSEWQKEILKHHRHRDPIVNWDNCFPPRWRTDPWELAKAYMPRGQSKVKSADQCDASALLNLINFCDWFDSVDHTVVREVIRHRNELMHNCELGVKDEWMTQYQTSLRNFLLQFRNVPKMAEAGREIKEMLTVDLSIWVSGFDGMDSADLFGLETDNVSKQEFSADLISQWEAELLQERLQELLYADDDTEAQDSEQLKRLAGFLQNNRDLCERFSAELQTINSLEAVY